MPKTIEIPQLNKFITKIKNEASHYIMSGGMLCVNDRNYDEFVAVYSKLVDAGFNLDIVEKQSTNPVRRICLDFDFKAETSSSKQPVRTHITSIFSEMINEFVLPQLAKYCDVDDNQEIRYSVFVRETPYLKDSTIKDGAHITFNVKMEQSVWKKLIEEQFTQIYEFLKQADVNFTNSIDDIIDKAFLNGQTSWMLYGSDKPDNFGLTTPYKLSEIVIATFNKSANSFSIDCVPDSEIEAYTTKDIYTLKTIHDSDEIQVIGAKKQYIVEKKPKLKLVIEDEPKQHKSLNNLYVELIESIGLKFIDAYSSWRDIVWAICSLGEEYKDIAKQISAKSNKWEDDTTAKETFEKLWSSCDKTNYTIGTLKHYSRLTDERVYLTIQSKFTELKQLFEKDTDADIAKVFVHLFGDDFQYEDEEVWRWGGVVWELDNKNHFMRSAIANKLALFYRTNEATLTKQKADEENEDAIKMLDARIKKLQSIQRYVKGSTGCGNVIKMILDEFATKQKNKVAWDTKPHLFAFTNVVFDLRDGNKVEPNKFDYMRLSTGYEWRDPTREECDDFKKVISQILPTENIRKMYSTILATGLIGQTLQKFSLAYGKGRNGKGVINELMLQVVGEYGYVLSSSALQTSQNGLGSCPELAQLAHKRFVVCREPDIKKKINVSIVKELTGGDTFKARSNYSNKTEQHICMTLIMELNPPRIQLGGKANNALLERVIEVPFNSFFTQDQDDVDEERNIYIINQQFSSKEWKLKHRFAMFAWLVKHSVDYYKSNQLINTFIPSEIKELSKQYVFGSDEVYRWFKDTWKFTGNDTDIIKQQDALNEFRATEVYKNLDRDEKKLVNLEFVKSSLDNEVKLVKSFHERFRQQTGGVRRETRNCWVGWVIKNECDTSDIEVID